MNEKGMIAASFLVLLAASCSGQGRSGSGGGQAGLEMRVLPDWTSEYSEDRVERAVLAGGCFWGVEGVFEQLEGVLDVRSGYAGGDAGTADYRTVSTGTTGHAESVEIVFDPERIDYETLLEVFFTVAHDPTQLNRQGPDHGPQYRSAVFFIGADQERTAREAIADLEESKLYSKPIVTEVSPLKAFYPAEEYHQDFMRLNPSHPYITYWDVPKLLELRAEYPELIASGEG